PDVGALAVGTARGAGSADAVPGGIGNVIGAADDNAPQRRRAQSSPPTSAAPAARMPAAANGCWRVARVAVASAWLARWPRARPPRLITVASCWPSLVARRLSGWTWREVPFIARRVEAVVLRVVAVAMVNSCRQGKGRGARSP